MQGDQPGVSANRRATPPCSQVASAEFACSRQWKSDAKCQNTSARWFPWPFKLVQHKPELGFQAKYVAAMYDRIRQARIAVVACDEKVERTAHCPVFDAHFGKMPPGKRAGRFRLIHTVNLKRIVRCSAAKHLAFGTSTGINKRSRVHEYVTASDRELNAECIGMTVSATVSTMRSGVNG